MSWGLFDQCHELLTCVLEALPDDCALLQMQADCFEKLGLQQDYLRCLELMLAKPGLDKLAT